MATYVIGDIHGCWKTLKALLTRFEFNAGRDTLWLVGDLVNGGPGSHKVLQWARKNDSCVTAVLGNHDLYFLARALGVCGQRKRDTLDRLLKSRRCKELAGWLLERSVIHQRDSTLMVHAGVAPGWTVAQSVSLAAEVETALQDRPKLVLKEHFNGWRQQWSEELEGIERVCCALQILTMIRTCLEDGELCMKFSGPPELAPPECRPWYELRPSKGEPTYLFGHWAALGYRALPIGFGLDSGCVWGQRLTALRLEDQMVFQQESLD